VAGSADSFSIMLFVVNMLFVVMLVLDCLVCVYGVRIEDRSEYLTCIANPAGCTWLYAARPSPCSVCEPVTRSPSLSEWADGGLGTQVAVQPGAHGHHADGAGVVNEHDETVRYLSTLHPACRVERW
jgi:hypothetical protein